jgi:hypothetical protein
MFFRPKLAKNLPKQILWMHSNSASEDALKTSKAQAEFF